MHVSRDWLVKSSPPTCDPTWNGLPCPLIVAWVMSDVWCLLLSPSTLPYFCFGKDWTSNVTGLPKKAIHILSSLSWFWIPAPRRDPALIIFSFFTVMQAAWLQRKIRSKRLEWWYFPWYIMRASYMISHSHNMKLMYANYAIATLRQRKLVFTEVIDKKCQKQLKNPSSFTGWTVNVSQS